LQDKAEKDRVLPEIPFILCILHILFVFVSQRSVK